MNTFLSLFQAPPHIVTDVNKVSEYLTVRKETCEKLIFPEISLPQNPANIEEGVR